jgi:hypothetical protein
MYVETEKQFYRSYIINRMQHILFMSHWLDVDDLASYDFIRNVVTYAFSLCVRDVSKK